MGGLQFRGILTVWRDGLTRTTGNSRKNIPSPASGEEQSKAPAHTEGKLSGRQLCREGPGGASGHKVDRKQRCRPLDKEGQHHPGFHCYVHFHYM